jgi:hypothetical protein
MQERTNSLKMALAAGQAHIGIWCSLGSALTTEIVAGAGAGWLLIDGEHAPNHLLTIMAQLQVAAAFSSESVVRPRGACRVRSPRLKRVQGQAAPALLARCRGRSQRPSLPGQLRTFSARSCRYGTDTLDGRDGMPRDFRQRFQARFQDL